MSVSRVRALGAALSCLLAACAQKERLPPTHRGMYLGWSQLNTFTPCNEQKLYWVEGRASYGLQARYRAIARRPFQPIYVELTAAVAPPGNRMPMEGHDGFLRVDSVLAVGFAPPDDCKIVAPEE